MASFLFVSSPRSVSRFSLILKPSLSFLGRETLAPPFARLRQSSSIPSALAGAKAPSRLFSSLHSAAPVVAWKSSELRSGRDDVVILGIETSCDDTAAAIVRGDGEILSQVVSSQADLLSRYGGVAPKMAEEAHSLVIDQVVAQALENANLTGNDLSAVAVTIGPGLSLCLRVGVQKARRIAGQFSLPIVGVHHMEAHALVARLIERDLQFPFLALLISGGHNLLILAHQLGHYLQLGTTIDDAIGEAYDKTARWLGLDMRKGGGPALEELALEGDPNSINFSVPMRRHKDCNFSYAGLKTQVRLAMESRNINMENSPISLENLEDRRLRADIAASFQRVAVLHLEERCQRAIEWALKIEPSIKYLVVSGGVASNKYVRARLNDVVENNGLQLVCPPPSLCTDNGATVQPTLGHKDFAADRINAFVCDLTIQSLSEIIQPSSVDIVTMIFVLSAVSPEKMHLVLHNISRVLKPNGLVLFRDYATGDLAQERLISKEQQISENFYVRGDGTRAYYFSDKFLESLFKQNEFTVEELDICNKQVENRSMEVVMNRRWIQATFSIKPEQQNEHKSISHNCLNKLSDPEDDISSSVVDMFSLPSSADEVIKVEVKGYSFTIKALGKEYQHTCKSTGLMLWESAHLMCNLMAENPLIISGKRVLELGCGSAGICSMLAAHYAEVVVATDGDAEALNLLRENMSSNLETNLLDKVVINRLIWGNRDDIQAIKDLGTHEGFDIIIGTDVTYSYDAISPLFATARELISNQKNGNCKPALVLCHIERRIDENSIVSSALHFGFKIADRWINGMQLSHGIISSWFSKDASYMRLFRNTPLTILYFDT